MSEDLELLKQSAFWYTYGSEDPKPGQYKALDNFLKALKPWEVEDIACVEIHPGMIEGLAHGIYPIVRYLYDIDTGELFECTVENLLDLPKASELHLSKPKERKQQFTPEAKNG